MNPTIEPFSNPDAPNRSHYRRRKKLVPPMDDTSRSELLETLAKRVSPNFDFFLFALLSGVVIGLAFLFNSYALLIAAALLAPIMMPFVGISLATAIGGSRFFFLSLAGSLVGCILVFITGALAGTASLALPMKVSRTVNFTVVSWDVLLVIILGVILIVLSIMKGEQKPVLPSAAIAYVLFSTAGGAGFEIGQGHFQAAVDGGLTFGFYMMLVVVTGAVIFLFYGFRSQTISGYSYFLVLIALIGIFIIQFKPFNPEKFLSGLESLSQTATPAGKPQAIESSTPTISLSNLTQTPLPTNTPSQTPTSTPIPSQTLTPSNTPTIQPTGDWVKVDVDGQTGARIREKPGFGSKLILIIENGSMVKLLPGVEFKDNVYWAHVETNDGTIGWMVHTTLSTFTPTTTTTPAQE